MQPKEQTYTYEAPVLFEVKATSQKEASKKAEIICRAIAVYTERIHEVHGIGEERMKWFE